MEVDWRMIVGAVVLVLMLVAYASSLSSRLGQTQDKLAECQATESPPEAGEKTSAKKKNAFVM